MMFIENFFHYPWWFPLEINLHFFILASVALFKHQSFNQNPSLSSSSSLSVPAAFVGAVSDGASSLHPPVLPAECCGQRGADQIVWGVSGPGERSQALPHAASRTARNADAQDQAETFCWYARKDTDKSMCSVFGLGDLTNEFAGAWSATHQCNWPRTHEHLSIHTEPFTTVFYWNKVTQRSGLSTIFGIYSRPQLGSVLN